MTWEGYTVGALISPLSVLVIFLAGISASIVLPGRLVRYSYGLFALGAAVASVLTFGNGLSFDIRLPVSIFFSMHFSAGGLGSFFCLVLSVIALSVSIYSIGYTADMDRPRIQAVLFSLFIISMYAVFLSADVLTFLISWEVMSLVSYFLVTARIEDDDSHRTGLIYAVMTHTGTAAIITSFLMMATAAGSLEFDAVRSVLSEQSPLFRSMVFVFAFAGFGTKAGIVPLHVWLPEAHPAAPSNASALMSGVMIKSGIYGILFVAVDLLGADTAWWGWAVLVVGAVSSILGILYALMEKDIKRLLAYSSVENIGIILLAIGSGMLFSSYGMPGLAALAIAAGLYHTINHALFKGLLFMGSGTVIQTVGTKNIEAMGGLIRRMPLTAFFFLTGSVAICALPPFNGFVSEWLIFQSLVLGIKTPVVGSKVMMIVSGAALAMTGAVAAACFVKAFGISFLGLPRSLSAEKAEEAPAPMLAGMAVPAVLCLVLGVMPGIVLDRIADTGLPVVDGIREVAASSLSLTAIVRTPGGFSALSMPVLFLALAGSVAVLLITLRVIIGRAEVRKADVWDCGIGAVTPRMQYTATAFTKPIRVIFDRLYRARRDIRISYRVPPFFVEKLTYHSEITPIFEKWLYRPIIRAVGFIARRIQLLQSGSLHLYLGYVLGTLIILLLVWGR